MKYQEVHTYGRYSYMYVWNISFSLALNVDLRINIQKM